MAYKVELNTSIPYNYSFYCPISNLALDRSNNVAYVDDLTPSLRRGIHANTILSEEYIVQDKVDEGIEVNEVEVEAEVEAEEVVDVYETSHILEDVVNVIEEPTVEEPKKEKKPRKSSKKK